MTSPSLPSPPPFTFHRDPLYPDSDGQPIADNTLQFDWIDLIKGNLDAIFRNRDDVFVAADLLWYPVEGEPTIRLAPDGLVAFGRPKGYRGSYKQWEEGGIAPQVVFEVLSPKNTTAEMAAKFHFYDEHGVEEYYVIDPERNTVEGYTRSQAMLRPVPRTEEVVSPRLGIRFRVIEGQLRVFRPDGTRFLTFVELVTQLETLRDLRKAQNEAEQARQRVARLAEKLRALGIDPDA